MNPLIFILTILAMARGLASTAVHQDPTTALLNGASRLSRGHDSAALQKIVAELKLQRHPEGGYYVETDRDPLRVPNPFLPSNGDASPNDNDTTRSASTTIFYLLTPSSPRGVFHTNKARTVHTLHRGRGRYVVIHPDERRQSNNKARVETFVVGSNVEKGEKLQWIVEGGKYKASFLLPDEEKGSESGGLLISEVCYEEREGMDLDWSANV